MAFFKNFHFRETLRPIRNLNTIDHIKIATMIDNFKLFSKIQPMDIHLPAKPEKKAASRFPLLIVAGVSGLIAFLFFVMATMDLRRIENVLIDMLKKQGLHQVEHFGEYALYGYRQLVNVNGGIPGVDPLLSLEEGYVSIQEHLVTDLVDLARDLDRMERTLSAFTEETAAMLAENRHVTDILFFDPDGELVIGQAPFSAGLMSYLQRLLSGRAGVSLKLFKGPYVLENGGYVGIRRPDGRGAVFVCLDGESLRFWAWKTALARAAEEMQWRRGLVYFGVFDDTGAMLTQTGDASGLDTTDAVTAVLAQPALKKSDDPKHFTATQKDAHLEIAAVLDVLPAPRSIAVLALSMDESEVVLGESKRHIIVSTLLMMMIGLLAMGILYGVQNRHVNRVRDMTEQLNKARRLQSLGRLGAGMAHEIRNPLNSISMAAQRLSREYPVAGEKKPGYDRITEVIAIETRRLNNLVDDFLTFSSSGNLRLQMHSMKEIISRVVFLLQPEASDAGILIEVSEKETGREILIDPDRMEQALMNIIRNAFDAMPQGGHIRIDSRYGKDAVSLRITDNGTGIAQEDLDNIFDPSFTTRDKGVGLGLAIAHEIVTAHDGEILVESSQNQGTTFEIIIPVKQSYL